MFKAIRKRLDAGRKHGVRIESIFHANRGEVANPP
jgi:hypothetical protein